MSISLKKRIWLGYSFIIVLLVIVSLVAYFTISNIAFLSAIVKENTEKNVFIMEREIDHLLWIQGLDLYLLSNQDFKGESDYTKCGFGKWLYSSEIRNTKDPRLSKLLKQIEQPHIRLHSSAEQIVKFKESGNEDSAKKVYLEVTLPALKEIRENMNQIRLYYNEVMIEKAGRASNDIVVNSNRSKITILLVSIIAIVVGIILGITISKHITNILKAIMERLTDGFQQIVSAINQLSSVSQSLSEGTSEQAASVEEMTSTMNQISSSIKQNADNSAEAEKLAELALVSTEQGTRSVMDLVSAMKEINSSTQEMSNVIKLIDDIAFQTNLLALNASIEAARAGEYGKSFAVVADEVRNLARKTTESAKDISKMIQDNIERTKIGSELADKSGEALGEILINVKKVSNIASEVKSASKEQAEGMNQINKAISQTDTVTQRNASIAEESASSSEELSSQAQMLDDIIKQLQKVVG